MFYIILYHKQHTFSFNELKFCISTDLTDNKKTAAFWRVSVETQGAGGRQRGQTK